MPNHDKMTNTYKKTTTTVTTRTTKKNKTQYGRNKHEQSMNYFLQFIRSLMINGVSKQRCVTTNQHSC